MEKLVLLSQDKATLTELRNYLQSTLEKKLIAKALRKEDVTGFAEANNIIKTAIDEIDALTKSEKKSNNINQAE